MIQENSTCVPGVRVIVVANEKGGSGKSTVAVNIAVALMRAGESVATLDLDSRQRSFTNYIENRRAWSTQSGKELPTPSHLCLQAAPDADEVAVFADALDRLAADHDYLIVDTPGHNHRLAQVAHASADTLITPLNDSFVDLDVLGSVDAETFAVNGISHYGSFVEEARRERALAGKPELDWIVLRNRMATLSSRNNRFVGDALDDLAQRLRFRCVEGLAERVIFREFYPRGLTAIDELDKDTLGTRPTMSHVSAQLEVQGLLAALLGRPDPRAVAADRADAA
jgi:chromosome partitioning protein